jgi:hypothetical protein
MEAAGPSPDLIPADDAMSIIRAIAYSVRQNMTDPKARARIASDTGEIISRGRVQDRRIAEPAE